MSKNQFNSAESRANRYFSDTGVTPEYKCLCGICQINKCIFVFLGRTRRDGTNRTTRTHSEWGLRQHIVDNI